MAEEKIVVETKNLTKIYGDGDGVHALDGVNVMIHAGEFVAVMGPSGSGKSTLLNIIGALDRPTGGLCMVNGQDLAKVKDLDRFRSKTVGFVFQLHNLIPTLTSAENVEVPLQEENMSDGARRARALELLKLVGLSERAHFMPGQLSGGQRQRVAIARALSNKPAIILADEPTGNLDSKSTDEIMDLLRQLNREHGTTFIVVTHNPAVARAADRIITVRDGKIRRDEKIDNIFLEDLREFKESALGHAILDEHVPGELNELGFDRIATEVKRLLEKV
ncbi:sulfonate transport system ATP-binding protein [Anaerolineae bacterium]|nr:sulfonate transport system ATP-binding protein [Anaerolineae bacterium]